MKSKFYICRHCGNLIEMINDTGVPVVCCGKKMEALIPNTADAAGEKHVPAVSVEGTKITINIGQVNHPMQEEHYIEWIYVQTENGGCRKALKPTDEPKTAVCIDDDKVVAVFAYCNLHGLWMTEIH